jgi:hypothetical protein
MVDERSYHSLTQPNAKGFGGRGGARDLVHPDLKQKQMIFFHQNYIKLETIFHVRHKRTQLASGAWSANQWGGSIDPSAA